MRKSVKIREIYRELRYATAGTASAIDLIRLAHLILKSYNFEDDSSFKFQDQVKLREISFLPLDEALSDGGWRILNFEQQDRKTLDDERVSQYRDEIERLLGSEWPNQLPRD